MDCGAVLDDLAPLQEAREAHEERNDTVMVAGIAMDQTSPAAAQRTVLKSAPCKLVYESRRDTCGAQPAA
jgi:hypothetical protein